MWNKSSNKHNKNTKNFNVVQPQPEPTSINAREKSFTKLTRREHHTNTS